MTLVVSVVPVSAAVTKTLAAAARSVDTQRSMPQLTEDTTTAEKTIGRGSFTSACTSQMNLLAGVGLGWKSVVSSLHAWLLSPTQVPGAQQAVCQGAITGPSFRFDLEAAERAIHWLSDEDGAHALGTLRSLRLVLGRCSRSMVVPANGFIAGNFELIQLLGEGSCGSVWKARELSSRGNEVAIKIIPIEEEGDVSAQHDEITILQRCASDFIVGYNSHFFNGDSIFLCMEYCSAGSVLDLMRIGERTLNSSELRAVCSSVLCGLWYLHDLEIVHRDVKAGNILLTMDGKAKLADLGLATEISAMRREKHTMLGSPHWMAPEVALEHAYDEKIDIWSLGITLLEMAEGEVPYAHIPELKIVFMIPSNPPPTLVEPAQWPSDMTSFLARCVEKDSNFRLSASSLAKHPWVTETVSHCKREHQSLVLSQLVKRTMPQLLKRQNDNPSPSSSSDCNGGKASSKLGNQRPVADIEGFLSKEDATGMSTGRAGFWYRRYFQLRLDEGELRYSKVSGWNAGTSVLSKTRCVPFAEMLHVWKVTPTRFVVAFTHSRFYRLEADNPEASLSWCEALRAVLPKEHAAALDIQRAYRGFVVRNTVRNLGVPAIQPEGTWTEQWDPHAEHTYWANEVTGESRWTNPYAVAAVQANSAWTEHFDPRTQHPYWANKVTGKSSWTDPCALSAIQDDSSAWTIQWDSITQHAYWFNDRTRESSWTDPRTPGLIHGGAWTRIIDAVSGSEYFVNQETGEVAWSIPSSVQGDNGLNLGAAGDRGVDNTRDQLRVLSEESKRGTSANDGGHREPKNRRLGDNENKKLGETPCEHAPEHSGSERDGHTRDRGAATTRHHSPRTQSRRIFRRRASLRRLKQNGQNHRRCSRRRRNSC